MVASVSSSPLSGGSSVTEIMGSKHRRTDVRLDPLSGDVIFENSFVPPLSQPEHLMIADYLKNVFEETGKEVLSVQSSPLEGGLVSLVLPERAEPVARTFMKILNEKYAR